MAVEFSTGTFLLSPQTRILGVDRESRRIAGLFNDYLRAQHGLQLRTDAKPPPHVNFISFGPPGSGNLPAEGYRLAIGPDSIRISGRGAGLFYGMQTLTQLLPARQQPAMELPGLDITDYPRFGYRGLLLDVGRHFFSVATSRSCSTLPLNTRSIGFTGISPTTKAGASRSGSIPS